MIPYKSQLATAVPKSLDVRLEIVKVMRALAQDQDEALRQRRAEIASIRHELEAIARDIRNLCREWPLSIRAELRKHGYNPDEPRLPKHNPGAGEWTRLAAADDLNDTSDAPPFPRQPNAEGHHWVPKTVFRNRDFSQETKGVFEKSTSGPLADRSVNYNDAEHRAYNDAVDKLLDAFLEKNNITEEQMTPAQASEFVQEVIGSTDLRIRGFVIKIRQEVLRYNLRYGPWRRGGGGDED
jgi:hypothetical protein